MYDGFAMPANLTPAYKAAEERYRAAVTPEEKIAALEEMLSAMPKHKGTEKLQADLKSRIARLKRAPKKKPDTRGQSHRVPKEGAGQVALVGPPNAGKSSLVAGLTHADPEVAEYPHTSREATPGMMPFEDTAFQLVDLPPVSEEYTEAWVFDLVRAADLVWLVLDVERALEGLESVEGLLAGKGIALVPARLASAGEERGGAAQADDEAKHRPGWAYKETVLVLTGIDRQDAREDLPLLERLLEEPFPRVAVSSVTGEGIEDLGRLTFDALKVLRVYTKQPGHEADLEQPFALPIGSTVEDLARLIHQDLAEGLKFARVWGKSVHDGQRVQGGHELEEGDVVEIHL